MIVKEIYVPIYSYMVRYIEVEDFSYKEKRKLVSYIKKLGYYDDFINDINNIMNNKSCGAGTTYHNNQKTLVLPYTYTQEIYHHTLLPAYYVHNFGQYMLQDLD